jgi:uncharacterized protein YciI
LADIKEQTLFVVILRYLVPIETILEQRPAHVEFLDKYYAKGVFHASGPQIPRYGGVLIAQAKNRDELKRILEEDPFCVYKSAEYQITEFTVNKQSGAFASFLAKI